ENRFLRHLPLHRQREPRFGDLAAEAGLSAGELLWEEISGELHRDGARAGCTKPVEDVVDDRASDAPEVDTLVLEKATVLDRNESERHVRREIGQRDDLPPLPVEETDESALRIID